MRKRIGKFLTGFTLSLFVFGITYVKAVNMNQAIESISMPAPVEKNKCKKKEKAECVAPKDNKPNCTKEKDGDKPRAPGICKWGKGDSGKNEEGCWCEATGLRPVESTTSKIPVTVPE